MRGKEEMVFCYSKWLFIEENASVAPMSQFMERSTNSSWNPVTQRLFAGVYPALMVYTNEG